MLRTSWFAVASWVVVLVGALASGCGGGNTGADDMGAGDGAAGQCAVASDCPALPCSMSACVDTRCVETPLPDGPAPASAQTSGDCQQVICTGGAVGSDDDDDDVPASSGCATGTCEGGVPLVTPAPIGQACNEDGGAVCNGDSQAPACVGCNQPADCTDLPEDDECQTRTCVDHVCGQTFADAGTVLALQTPRDCQETQCDGSGGVMSVNADLDLPDDLNDCTDDLCQDGVPEHPDLESGVACGNGSLACDGSGQCIGCVDADECGDDTFCAANTCNAGVCGRAFASAGMLAPANEQAPGDCQILACDGAGGLVPMMDDSDLPQDDGDECTAQTCVDGAPLFPPAPLDTPCASGGSFCDGSGACVGCNAGSQCGTDTACVQYVCVDHTCAVLVAQPGTPIPSGSQVAGDCRVLACGSSGSTQSSPDDTDLPVDGNDCTADLCNNGVPSNPPTNAGGTCGDGTQMCNDSGQCQSCFDASDCEGGTYCNPIACIAGACVPTPLNVGTPLPDEEQSAGECDRAQCDGSGGVEVVADNTDVPSDTGNECTQASCGVNGPGSVPLSTGSACSEGGIVCDGSGQCVACNANSDCGVSTACQLQVCVNHACEVQDVAAGTPITEQTTGDCQVVQCNGSGGTTSVADDGDTPNDQNVCTVDTCSGGAPQHTVTPDAACGAMGNGVCNPSGECVGCNTASDCGADTFCRSYSCVNNTCQVNNVAANTVLPAGDQTSGDCRTVVCDGGGGTTTTADPVDVPPEDGNECTISACSGSTPVQNPTVLGVPCNGTDLCNGSGVCVECLAASDCGFDTFCAQFACVNNMCQQTNTAVGTALPPGSQTPLDCQVRECDGSGDERSVALDTDFPIDGNPCTLDLCTAGVPSNPPATVNTACAVDGGTYCDGGGQCVQCTTPSQCGTDTFCQTYTCETGACGTAPTSLGTPLPGQTAGDCQELQCNGAGGTTSVADDTDVPDDDNQCTDDICMFGVPTNPNRLVNTGCAENGGTYCNGAGACVQCNAALQCGTNTFCAQFACNAGMCDVTNTAAGTDLPSGSQSEGDCQVLECDGLGQVRSVALDTDAPNDGNECTADLCTSGVPSNPNRPLNFACGSGDYCDGSGACVDCNSASQCGTNTFCQAFTCFNKTCGTSNTAAGTDLPAGAQTTGDCQVLECDGLGAQRSVALDTDVFVDGNPCTNDVCADGVPENPPVSAGATCNGDQYCDGSGSCVACLSANDCGTSSFCETFTCNAGVCGQSFTSTGTALPMGQTTGDCQRLVCDGAGGVSSVAHDTDVPNDGNSCTSDTCTSGTPTFTNLPDTTPCGMSGMCLAGSCVGCAMASDCGVSNFCVTYSCNSNSCGVSYTPYGTALPSQTAGDCQTLVCDGAGSTISIAANGDVPVDGNECTNDVCTAGVPSNPNRAINTACGVGDYCNGAGVCVDCNSAAQCGTNTFCRTYTCNSNTCGVVNTAAGTDLPAGSQTTGDCRVLQCNGSGGTMSTIANGDVPNDNNPCTSDTCAAGTPTFTNLAINTACGSGDYCNGAGACVDCNMASQCGSSTFCRTYTCNSNTCGFTNTAAGTDLPAGSQTPGDCRVWECNGSGGTVNSIYNADIPVDGNPCTNDICTAGTPSNPNSTINTPCGSGDFCNGSGTCVDCNSAGQCPSGNQCQVATCTSNTCGLGNRSFGYGCNDGLFCTSGDYCNGLGSCIGGSNPCNSQCQTCNEVSDVCVNRAFGYACNDGLFCTATDYCSGGSCTGGGNPCDSQCQTCNETSDTCPIRTNGTACVTPAAGRNNVCHVAQCSGGLCGRRINRFLLPSVSSLWSNGSNYAYSNVPNFSTCTACHGASFSFTEAWSESSDYSIFDSYCQNWGSNSNRFYYGNRRSGCVLYLLDNGIMPQGSPQGAWAYDDEYLNWYCSAAGPGGGVFGW